MVKADAYGCGIEQVPRALAKAGCNTFFVADLPEARRARATAPAAAIYVLNGLLPGTAAASREATLAPGDRQPGRAGAEWDAFRADTAGAAAPRSTLIPA